MSANALVTMVVLGALELDAGEPVTELFDAGVELAAGVAPVDGGFAVEAVDGGVADAGAPLPKGFTGLVGRVFDTRTGEGLIEATVKVVQGAKKSALTDLDGRYRLKLPPGTYDLRVFSEMYEGRRVTNVTIKAGAATTLDVALSSDSRAVQEVVVEAKADKRNESALLMERKKSAVVSDSVGAQELARTPDANAGDASKRVVSVTVADGKYVFIRGLGGRYAQTLINGTLMPSPEPDEPSAPLDLFPTALVSNLNVLKTYSADLPGNFGGGSLTVDTATFPTALEAKVTAQLAGDTQTTFLSRPSEPMTLGQQLGFQDPARALPATFPRDRPLAQTSDPAKLGVTADQQRAAGQSLVNRWAPGTVNALPNGSLGAQLGNTFRLGPDARLGVLVAAQTRRKEHTRRISTQDTTIDNEQLVGVSQTATEYGTVSGATSALANIGLKLSRDHELSVLALALTATDDQAIRSQGADFVSVNDQKSARLQFTQKQLFFNQVSGFHRIGALADLEVDWQLNYSRVDRNEPDIRDTRYFINDDGTASLRYQPNSAERFFLTLGEDMGGGSVNVTLPWRTFRFRVGGLGQYSTRFFDGRRFRFFPSTSFLPTNLRTLSAEELFTYDRIGPGAGTTYFLNETTFSSDRYTSSLSVFAGYALVDWSAASWFRAQAGLRYEGSTQSVDGNSPFATSVMPTTPVTRQNHNALPTVNLVFTPRENVNVRAAYAYTLARPTFRELAPFLFFDVVRRRNISGNPKLEQTGIHHADLRGEWFMTESEVLSVSAFAKQFEKPIERVIVGSNSSSDFGFRNARGATLLGTEFEARMSLGRVAAPLRDFRLSGNFALMYSRIQVAPDSGNLGTADRALQGQSPFVGNVALTWLNNDWGLEAGIFYNVYGPRISEVAVLPQPDIVEQTFHKVDVMVSKKFGTGLALKLAAANVLNQAIRLQQGPVEVLRYPTGVQFSATLSWSPPAERN